MQKRVPISSMDLKTYIGNIRKNPRFTEEIVKLVEEDLRFGLTKEETEEYTGGKYDYKQMMVYSKCLRNNYCAEVKAAITKEGLTGEQMAVALEFYDKGVPLSAIEEVTEGKEATAFVMKELFLDVLSKMRDEEAVSNNDRIYVKDLLTQVKEVVSRIEDQEKRYDLLNEKLGEIYSVKEDAQIQNNLLLQLAEKDNLMELQQNEVNEAKTTIIKLRNKVDDVRKEKDELENRMKEIEQIQKNGIEEGRRLGKTEEDNKKKQTKAKTNAYHFCAEDQCQEEIANGECNIVQVEQIEKKRNPLVTTQFSKIFHRKKDLIHLLVEKKLTLEQLIQVKTAMEKGLTEQQIFVLVNSKISAEQMKEIIDIAVFENSQRQEK